MVAMAVRMRDHQVDRPAAMLCLPCGDQPVDRRADFQAAGAAVDQQHTVMPEDQIEEWRLEIGLDLLHKE